MKSNYKPLGDFIREIDDRNLEDSKENLLGVSVQKKFIESKSNTIGTDFTLYKKIRKSQFVYVPDTGRRGEKIGIALLESHEHAMVSQVYTVFTIKDTKLLLPEYLMMWFRRPEFDRYARFKSNGSVREIFDWEDMCNVTLPIPSIDKQKEIVKEYHVIIDRITLNNQLIRKLEETAQAIYKQWFVNKQNENKKVPLSQYLKTNPQISIKKNAITTYVEMNDLTTNSMGIVGSVKRGYIGGSKFQNQDTLLARITPCLENGKTAFVDILESDEIAAGSTEFIVMRAKGNISPYWVYCLARDDNFRSYAISSMVGSSGRERVHEKYLEKFILTEINQDAMDDFHLKVEPLFKLIRIKTSEVRKLEELKDLLLSKLATIET